MRLFGRSLSRWRCRGPPGPWAKVRATSEVFMSSGSRSVTSVSSSRHSSSWPTSLIMARKAPSWHSQQRIRSGLGTSKSSSVLRSTGQMQGPSDVLRSMMLQLSTPGASMNSVAAWGHCGGPPGGSTQKVRHFSSRVSCSTRSCCSYTAMAFIWSEGTRSESQGVRKTSSNSTTNASSSPSGAFVRWAEWCRLCWLTTETLTRSARICVLWSIRWRSWFSVPAGSFKEPGAAWSTCCFFWRSCRNILPIVSRQSASSSHRSAKRTFTLRATTSTDCLPNWLQGILT
mmetsp:Transcript_97000/g.313208  ORF Transcript_97000/g.313208 Transcript_97000/m.313208 type:complete len:286 (+) Transcript_97000:1760-2617(+)